MIVFTLEGWVATRLEGEAMEGMVCTCEFPSSVEACVSRIEMVHNIIMHPSKSPHNWLCKVIKCTKNLLFCQNDGSFTCDYFSLI